MIMRYRALRHKQLVHTFGHFLKDFQDDIFYSEIPKLLHYTCTMEELKDMLDEYPNALKKLEEYTLIDIELKM